MPAHRSLRPVQTQSQFLITAVGAAVGAGACAALGTASRPLAAGVRVVDGQRPRLRPIIKNTRNFHFFYGMNPIMIENK